jgi:hypothetical protein
MHDVADLRQGVADTGRLRMRQHPLTIHRTGRVARREQQDCMSQSDEPARETVEDSLGAAVAGRRHGRPGRSDGPDTQPVRLRFAHELVRTHAACPITTTTCASRTSGRRSVDRSIGPPETRERVVLAMDAASCCAGACPTTPFRRTTPRGRVMRSSTFDREHEQSAISRRQSRQPTAYGKVALCPYNSMHSVSNGRPGRPERGAVTTAAAHALHRTTHSVHRDRSSPSIS